MRTLLGIAIHLIWGLWFGGLVALFISVLTLFHHDHALALQAAPLLFHAFEPYQVVLAVLSLLCAMLLRRKALVVLFVLTLAGAVVSPLVITPRISELQRRGETQGEEFGKLHGISMTVYMADTVVLLVSGVILATASKRASH